MSELTNIELEAALDRVLRGDQGAAQRIIDHNKALRAKLAAVTKERDQLQQSAQILAETEGALSAAGIPEEEMPGGELLGIPTPRRVQLLCKQLLAVTQERDALIQAGQP